LEPIDALRKAGSIASTIRSRIRGEVKPGVKIIDICDRVEGMTAELGGRPAFPCNVDIDRVAAHYTASVADGSTIPENSLVKIDIGVHVEGYIADTAITVCLNPELQYYVDAAEAALGEAIRNVRTGVRASIVGAAIEQTIKGRGLKPIRNLTGHKMARFVVHAGRSIPNVGGLDNHALEEDEVYAIEPFTVPPNAAGEVRDGAPSNIYRFDKKRGVSDRSKEILRFIQSEYRTLPFASRWVLRRFPGTEGVRAFNELLTSRIIDGYPQLVEKSNAMVAQAEHTVIVKADGCEVTTR